MSQESRLVITIDAKNAEATAKSLNDELKKVQTGGNQASTAIKSFGDGANAQTGKLKNLAASMKSLAAESSKYLAGIAGAVVGSAGALTALAVQYANTAAEIERFSYLSGTTTTQFQEWAVGAKAMGIEMEKLSDIFKDTRDRIGEFTQEGSGELTKFFKEIATKTEGGAAGALKLANAMRELSGPDALLLYVEKLEEAGVSQNEFVMYMESVADEATSLIPLLESGGEGFKLWAEAASNAGAIMDNETLAAAQRLKVETNLLTMQMDGLKNQFMSALLPALNQIASAILDTTEEGIRFNVAGEAVANTMLWLAKVGTGVAATFDIIGTTIGGAVAAMTDKNVTHQMVLDDLAKKLDGYGQKFEKLSNPTNHNKMVEALTKVNLRANEATKATASGAVNSKAMAKALDDGAKSADKLKQKTEQLAREAARLREKITYENADRIKKIEIDLQRELNDIRKAGFSGADASGFEANARNRAALETELYKAQLAAELNEWQDTETQKLDRKVRINELMIKLDSDMNDEFKEQALKSLMDSSNFELEQIELIKKQRLFSAEEAFLSEKDKIIRKYQLEREELAKIRDEQERNALLAASGQNEFNDISRGQQSAAQGFANAMGIDYSLELELQNKKNAILEYREWFSMTEAEFNAANVQAEQDYQAAKIDLALSSTEQIFGSMASMFDKDDARQKKYYKAMLTIEKTAAIARSAIAIQAGIAQASSQPFPENLAAMATVAAQTASIITNIKAIKTDGFADGGYTGAGGKYDVAGLVHRGEIVFSQADVARNGGVQAVEAMRKGDSSSGVVVQPNIIINIPDGYTAQQNVANDGTITIDVIDAWNQTLLTNPNSKTRKGLAQNTTAGARR